MTEPEKSAVEPAVKKEENADDNLDVDIDIDMNNPGEAGPAQTDGANDSDEVRQEGLDLLAEEARIPLRKDVSLREFLGKMDEYAPVIPDAVTFHALTLAGLPPPPLSALNQPSGAGANGTDPAQAAAGAPGSAASDAHTPLPLARLLALATQKFIADVAADAYQYSRMRSGTLTSNTLSAMANPGAPGPGAASGGAGGGGASGAGNKGPQAHVLGAPRAGFGGGGQGGGQGKTVLTMEDLGMAVGEYGVNIKRGEFYR